jgi:ribosomal protein S17
MDELRLIFAEHGLPEEVVSDNGPQFSSHEFANFMENNGIRHTLVAPYHPASNGAAERTVRLIKESLAKQVIAGDKTRSLKHRLASFLLRYRTTPHSVTGVSPAELMTKRQFRTRLSLVKPNLSKHVEKIQEKQKNYFDKNKCPRSFEVNDTVRVKNTNPKTVSKTNKWLKGTVVQVKGPRNYVVRVGESHKMIHSDHMVRAYDEVLSPSYPSQTSSTENVTGTSNLEQSVASFRNQNGACSKVPNSTASNVQNACSNNVTNTSTGNNEPNSSSNLRSTTPSTQILRRSSRVTKPVNKLDL